jgi:hypothetical protein
LQHYSQQPTYGNGQDAPLQTNGIRKFGIYTQWNFIQPQRMTKNDILSFTSKWTELENIILSEVSRAQKAKNCACSPSYADYRPKTNAVILLDMGHTLRGECAWEE